MIFGFGGVDGKRGFGGQQSAAEIDITLRPRHPAADTVEFGDHAPAILGIQRRAGACASLGQLQALIARAIF